MADQGDQLALATGRDPQDAKAILGALVDPTRAGGLRGGDRWQRLLGAVAADRRGGARAGRRTSTTAAKRSPSTRRVPAIGNALSTPRTSKGSAGSGRAECDRVIWVIWSAINGCPVLAEVPRCAGLIGAHQPAVTGDIGGQNGGKLAGRAHGPSGPAWFNEAA
jgi:hypothetical protein